MLFKKSLAAVLGLACTALGQVQEGVDSTSGEQGRRDLFEKDLSNCTGYVATKHWETESGFYADLSLAGEACNVFGVDLPDLKLEVEYQTEDRLHVKIKDTNNTVYQVPDEVFPRPGFGQACPKHKSNLKFNFNAKPFSFSVSRTDSGEVLFDTTGSKLVFESQYIYMRTHLPQQPHLYGLGEHSDPFMLNSTNYTRTLWTRDAYSVPTGQNLYGVHPIYFDHREGKTHGVFLLNSNGMDIYINGTEEKTLEYNIIGGVVDLYFIAGPTPKDVAMQYAEIVQTPLMAPYWGLGYHNCRYGYQDVYEVAAVVANYSAANIPLETMWTDIDYMDRRRIFTLDPERFPPHLMADLVNTIHERDQHYIVMVDPAVFASSPNNALDAGLKYDAFMKEPNGSVYHGVVWSGNSVFPDWFNPISEKYWDEQFVNFFDGVNGPDIDALWIDMNEPSNFCNRPYPCRDPEAVAAEQGNPPAAPPVRDGPDAPIPGFPESLQGSFANKTNEARSVDISPRHGGSRHGRPHHGPTRGAGRWGSHRGSHSHHWGGKGWGKGGHRGGHGWQSSKSTGSGCGENECKGLPNRELILPPYMIQNGAGPTLAEGTADTDVVSSNGLVQYDTHNLYGAMMSSHSQKAMAARRPDARTLVITRSTFAGAGKDVSHWLGDNISGWEWYRFSIGQQLQFAALYQIPFVGSDVCGFGGNTTTTLCARWALLGSFSPFFRNHNEISGIAQEFYRWPEVASAARHGISIRYQLLDYIYTALYRQNQTGLPCLNPLFFNYPEDSNTYPIDLQFFFGDGILVSPVTQENVTTVDYYLPDDQFYAWGTGKPVRGEGAFVSAEVAYDDIMLHYKGGIVYPQRMESANTTTALRTKGFNIVIAPGTDGNAEGSLYLDDGDSLHQEAVSEIDFSYSKSSGKFAMTGSFEYDPKVHIETITILGMESAPKNIGDDVEYDAENKKVVMHVDMPLTKAASMELC